MQQWAALPTVVTYRVDVIKMMNFFSHRLRSNAERGGPGGGSVHEAENEGDDILKKGE